MCRGSVYTHSREFSERVNAEARAAHRKSYIVLPASPTQPFAALMSPLPAPGAVARIALRCALLGLGLAACGGGEASTEPVPVVDRTPLKVVAGGGQSDTVVTTLKQALIVEVRDTSGKFSQGRTVRFTQVVRTSGGSAAVVNVSPL